ncbi:helix-turn-helix domain-containing protein [Leifsonia sp. 1010]|uniref:helix-turn-helix domain-containing protein n=1 Tax=Leifsonia sp. 1010 TaxID=2817769 RepID=UPI00285E4C59|nr:helix-turn-helix domain-containing protein [Leifsonia sp. 1010]MDR6613097.1 DNA-binding transcriptional ArsR family regulator [Leifsonia sp. 1010]
MANDEEREQTEPGGVVGGASRYEEALGMAALRALAHPLRVELMNELSDFGPATASMLAERLGESSGATSYHLRQLAKHDIIVEDTERGSGRERWWRMAPGGVTIGSAETLATPAGREASEVISLGWQQNNERRLASFLRRGLDTFGFDWMQSSTLSTSHQELTREQLAEFGREYYVLQERLREKWKAENAEVEKAGGEVADRKRVQIQFNAFPLVEQEDR